MDAAGGGAVALALVGGEASLADGAGEAAAPEAKACGGEDEVVRGHVSQIEKSPLLWEGGFSLSLGCRQFAAATAPLCVDLDEVRAVGGGAVDVGEEAVFGDRDPIDRIGRHA